VTGFTLMDLDVSPSPVGTGRSDFSGGGDRYMFSLRTPVDHTGTMTLRLPANRAVSAAGRGNEAAGFSWEMGPVPVTLAHTDGGTGPVNFPFDVTVTFAEAVTGFMPSDLEVSGGTAGNLRGTGSDHKVTITTDAGFADVLTVDLPANLAQNESGVMNAAAAQLSVTAAPPATRTPPDSLTVGVETAATLPPGFAGRAALSTAVASTTDILPPFTFRPRSVGRRPTSSRMTPSYPASTSASRKRRTVV